MIGDESRTARKEVNDMTKVLRLQMQTDPELGDDAPQSSYSGHHCVDDVVL